MLPDPDFPDLPLISVVEWNAMSRDERWKRHLQEVSYAASLFASRQVNGMTIFEAAKNLPVPRLNRGQSAT